MGVNRFAEALTQLLGEYFRAIAAQLVCGRWGWSSEAIDRDPAR